MTEQEGVWRVAHILLKNGVDIANRRAADFAGKQHEWTTDGSFGKFKNLLEQTCATQQAVLETFASENGKEVSIALTQGVVKGTVGEISDGRVHLTLASGADRVISLDEMDAVERLKRLSRTGDSSAGATLLKAVWAYHAHAVDRAKTLLSSLPDPTGSILVRVADEKP